MRRLMSVASQLDDELELLGKDALTPEVAEELATEVGASATQVYAAAALMSEIPCDASDPVRFEVCIGSCQQWGATELIDHLLKRHAQRRDQDAPTFGIVAKRCLDKCERAAVVFAHSPDGTASFAQATPDELDEAIETLLG
jgi:NADH:ubiquinone oxidoreductase subunit E